MRLFIVFTTLFFFFFFSACTCITLQPPVKGVYVGWEEIRWNNISGSIVVDPVDAGFNCVILNFFAPYDKDGFDAMEAWMLEDPGNKQSAVTYAHSKGAVVLGGVKLSASYGKPYSQNATMLGIEFANWAIQNLLDGLDINFQDINPGFLVSDNNGTVNLTSWALDVITSARSVLGSARILTIAAPPVSFGPAGYTDTYAGVTGGLLGVYKTIPDIIDYIFFWYFLQPANCVGSYSILFATTAGSDCSPQTAVNELLTAGAPIHKTVVAIADTTGDVTGYVDPTTFGSMLRTANSSLGWNTGIATWNWQGISFTSNWLNTVFAVPVVSTTTSTTTTSGSTMTSTTGGSTTMAATTGDMSTTTTITSGVSTTATGDVSTTTTMTTAKVSTTTTITSATASTTTTGAAATTAKVTTTTTTAKASTTTSSSSTTGTQVTTSKTITSASTSDATHTAVTVGYIVGMLVTVSLLI